jgi:hypothetical protein
MKVETPRLVPKRYWEKWSKKSMYLRGLIHECVRQIRDAMHAKISLSLLNIDKENYPRRASVATLKQSHEGDVVLIQATTWFVRCKLI